MKRCGAVTVLCAVLLMAGATGGCKLVKNPPEGADGQGAAKVAGKRGADMNALADEIWETKVIPHLQSAATDLATLGPAIASNLDAAGEAHGYRPSSEGSPWNFAVSVKGQVLAAKTDTRAATADVDVDGDGKPDAVLQLGPVIRGTALRDVLPFVDFTSFTDQIEFAKLSRALNTKAYETALQDIARDDLVGRRIEAVGAFTMRAKADVILVTPVRAEVSGQ